MTGSGSKGNNPEKWDKLLAALDEKLQLGLLDRLKRVISYHFEADTLYIEPGDEEDKEYLQKEPFLHQLELLAQDSINIETVKIK